MEAKPGGVVPSERAEIQVRSDRATGAGELVKFGQLVWYRSPSKLLATGRTTFRSRNASSAALSSTKSNKDSFNAGKSCDTSPFFKIEARPIGEHVRFFAQVASGSPCAWPPMVMRTKICRRELPREIWTTVQVRLNPYDSSGRVDIWLNGTFCDTYQGPITNMAPAATECPSSTHSHGSALS